MEIIAFLDKILLPIHIFFAFGSLIIFWIPVFTKLGGDMHRKTGKAYVICMWIVVFTSIWLSINNILEGHYQASIFLGFIAMITANPLWYGMAVLKHKKGLTKSYNYKQMAFNLLIFLCGGALVLLGLSISPENGGILMIIFGILGLATGGVIIKDLRTPPTESNWFITHMRGMVISGIATYTAFFAFGGRTLFENILTGYWMILPWVAPTVIGIFIMRRMRIKYEAKKAGVKSNTLSQKTLINQN
ncbi:MAG: hypothetical protein ACI85O_000536 [Saprospiraceae bacterium]|jgi:hypothetical protein